MALLDSETASAIPGRGRRYGRPPRRRVAIVGGGLSGLTAAYELSASDALRTRYEVTVYQKGWRLGGKLASGRNPRASMRNEEHGLHVWFGFYDNAFRMAREVLHAWTKPPRCPIQEIGDMLVPHDYTPVGIAGVDGYRVWDVGFEPNDAVPGDDPGNDPPELVLSRVLAVIRTNLRVFAGETGRPPQSPRSGRNASILRALLGGAMATVAERLSSRVRRVRGNPAHPDIVRARRWVAAVQRALPVFDRLVQGHTATLNARNALEFFAAFFMAITDPRDRILVDFDLDRVNHLDFRDWLFEHGASRSLLEQWPLVRVPYDATFQYLRGELDQPAFEAGTCARFFLRAYFGYRGSAAYLIGAGMGEALIAPMYEVLQARGVRFEFFHELERVELDDRRAFAEHLHFRRQARVRGKYDPLQTFAGLRCWSTDPDWSQLEDGEALREQGVRFEVDAGLGSARRLDRGRDFDELILALPAGVVASGEGSPVAEVVRVSPRLAAFVDAVNLVPSVAAQIWVDRSMEDLGWTRPRAAMVSWALPYSIWADMSDVLEVEGWGRSGPKTCHYLCGSHPFMASSPDPDARALDALRSQFEAHGGRLWPATSTPDGGFDWSVLHDPEGRHGVDRLKAQYIRANVSPSDVCDGAAPGTSSHRPEAYETGLQNVVFAGTWTRTNINSTCVEAATISGIAAARVLTGPVRTILNESFMQRARPVVCRPETTAEVTVWRVG